MSDPTMPNLPPPPSYTPPPAEAAKSRWGWLKRPLPLWVAIVALVAGIALGAASGGSGDKTETAAATSTSRSTTSFVPVTPVTAKPTTTATFPITTTTIATTTTPGVPVEVFRVSGSSDKSTETFTVVGDWDLAWSIGADGAGLIVNVISTTTGEIADISPDGGEEDHTIIREGCTCYLEISSFGSTYTLVATDIPG